jgi:copper chaperone NosL
MRAAAGLLSLVALAGCAGGPPEPAPLDTRNEACAACRMPVSEARFAAQVVAPGELSRFFDDLGCLAGFLKGRRAPAGAAVFVADHRTRAWIRAGDAVFTRVPRIATPMGSHLVAHASAASRDLDPAAPGGTPIPAAEILGTWNSGSGR